MNVARGMKSNEQPVIGAVQVLAYKKKEAAASSAAAEQIARAEEAHAVELNRIKSDATGAITTLMQVGAGRMMQVLAQTLCVGNFNSAFSCCTEIQRTAPDVIHTYLLTAL
jgi:hypothetical protein